MASFTQMGVEAIVKNFGKFNKDLQAVNKSIEKSGKNSAKTAKAMNRLGTTMSGIASGALVAVTKSLIAFGVSAVKEGAAFDKAMSNVAAVSGATAKEFANLEKQAEQLGATTKFTAVEAAEGMSFLAMAGFETIEIIGAMPGTLNLAAAANLDLGTSADVVSNILTGFGATADETGRFVDVLTNTFTSSNTTLQQLGQAMKFAAPVAKNLGLTIEDTAAAIGIMSNAGVQGALAGTTLRGVLLSLASPTKKAQTVMDELNISLFDAQGNMLPLPQIIGRVNAATAGMTQEQETLALKTLVGTKRLAGFQILLNAGEDVLADYTEELTRTGSAAEVAEKQLDNLSGDFTLFQSALSGFKIAAFDVLEPALRDATSEATNLFTALTEGARFFQETSKEADILTRAIENLLGIQTEQVSVTQESVSWLDRLRNQVGDNTQSVADGAVVLSKFVFGEEAVIEAVQEAAKEIENEAKEIENLTQKSAESTVAIGDQAQQTLELSRFTRTGNQAIVDTTLALQEERVASRALLDTQNDQTQIQVELSRIQFSSVDAINEQISATNSLTEAEEERIRVLEELSIQSSFFLDIRDAQQGAIDSELEFQASIASIRKSANEKTTSVDDKLKEKLVKIAEDREEKRHFVLTGAHARTQQANDEALVFWDAHFDKLVAKTEEKAEKQNQVFKQKAGEREAAAQAARQKELAAQAEHLEELKLNAALATLESAGQLAQFTGGLAVSAREAADLIRSGVLPVSQELGLAIQQSLQGLQQQESEAAETSATNQAIIQDALTGTLEPLEAQSLLVGTQLPADSLLLQEQMLRMNEDAQIGLESTRLATETEDLALQNVALVTLPQLQTQTTTTTQQMSADITAVDPSIIMLSTLMIKFGKDTEDTAEKIAEAMGQAKENFEEAAEAIEDDLVPAIEDATKAFRKMAEAAAKAASASSNAGKVAEAQTGMGFQSGTGPLGFRVPSGFENDSFPIRVSSGERVLVAPPGRSIENIVSSRVQQGNTTAFNMTVNTLAQPQSVIQQFEIMRALIG